MPIKDRMILLNGDLNILIRELIKSRRPSREYILPKYESIDYYYERLGNYRFNKTILECKNVTYEYAGDTFECDDIIIKCDDKGWYVIEFNGKIYTNPSLLQLIIFLNLAIRYYKSDKYSEYRASV
jgi:hypothetical protein